MFPFLKIFKIPLLCFEIFRFCVPVSDSIQPSFETIVTPVEKRSKPIGRAFYDKIPTNYVRG